jgi:hypothetical protein
MLKIVHRMHTFRLGSFGDLERSSQSFEMSHCVTLRTHRVCRLSEQGAGSTVCRQTFEAIGRRTARLTDIPHQNTSRTKTRPAPKHAKSTTHHQHKMRDKFIKSSRIDAAVAAIQRGEFSDYTNIARKYSYNRGAFS